MRVLILDEDKITKLFLPSVVSGAYIFSPSDEKEYLSIEAEGDNWIAKSNGSINVTDAGNVISKVTLNEFDYYDLKIINRNSKFLMFCMPTLDTTFKKLSILTDKIVIGKNKENSISVNVEFLEGKEIRIEKEENGWKLNVNHDDLYIYLNEKRVRNAYLKVGDSIFIYGTVIIWLGDKIQINNPANIVNVSKDFSVFQENLAVDNTKYDPVKDENDIILYDKNDFFFHKPRFIQTVELEKITIDSPPGSHVTEDLPWLLTYGSSFTMLAFSLINIINLLNNISRGTARPLTIVTSLVMSGAMIFGSLIMPTISKKYNKKRALEKEKERIEKYTKYIEKKAEEINLVLKKQTQILQSSNLHVSDCYNYACNGTQNIWIRDITDDDFLQVRLGKGNVPSRIDISAPSEHFTLQEDELKEKVYDIVNKSLILKDVPVTYNFTNSVVSAIISNDETSLDFINSILLQLVTLHSPNDLKIVSLFNKNNSILFNYMKYMPHSFSNDNEIRYFSENTNEAKNIFAGLKRIFDARVNYYRSEDNAKTGSYLNFSTYYLILCDNYMNIRDTQFINDIINFGSNIGFSIVLIDNSMQRLPKKCEHIISMDETSGAIIKKNLNNQQLFTPEFDRNIDMRKVGVNLMKVPILNTDSKSFLPQSISFLEMLKVSKIEQLNILNNWKNNNPVVSLQAPVGVHTDGDTFSLDLHEKYHGPHGLIAGATGSGKSEFIITYVLAMCINYHPDEVQFILIDYKGGGLAGAFYNDKTGIKVPHIVGVLTDLDTSDMNRAIVSINSELKRRERAFNEAKAITGESTIDIYKYQKYYREGILKDPISHLFIISDEFAELKSQQPDFMANLISISRIGRALGVHLILATQKPSGVVNDQIWSNSRFKVCLKVSTRSDSMEMLKRPDAASLKETGRFYLQVGYDEYFDVGQSGWSGAKYIPNDRIVKKLDDSISFIDNIATSYKSVNDITNNVATKELGDQLTNCVKHLTEISKKLDYKVKKLWLDRLPFDIYLSNLNKKYAGGHNINPYDVKTIIGEYDHPAIQAQNLLELDLVSRNTLIYGTNNSGLDELLKTIIFSTCIERDPNEINFYIIDMGAKSLRIFNKYPHVGDVCTIEDGEKILSMLMIGENEIAKRKELFIDYSGDYKTYIDANGEKLPLIVFVINYFDIFTENFGKIADALTTIFRDGPKYGIEFILTGNYGCVRYKTAEFFHNKMTLQLADREQYRTFLAGPRGLIPSANLGRGLAQIKNTVLEFQTAFIDEKSKTNDTIKKVGELLSTKYLYGAPNVPVVPKVVSLKMVIDSVKSIDNVIIGYDLNTKRELTFDFIKNKITPILAMNMQEEKSFIYAIIEEMNQLKNIKLQIIDVDNFIDFNKLNLIELYNQNFSSVMNNIYYEVTHPIQNMLNVYLIIGIGKLKGVLDSEAIRQYNSIFTYVEKLPQAYFIFVDDYESYKNLQIESWYSKSIDEKHGIWLGSGVGTQIAISFNKLSSDQKRVNIKDVAFASTKNKNYVLKKVVTLDEDEENEVDGK